MRGTSFPVFHSRPFCSTIVQKKENLTTCFRTEKHCLRGQDYAEVCILIKEGINRLRQKKTQILPLTGQEYVSSTDTGYA